jgi:hypothetical protein
MDLGALGRVPLAIAPPAAPATGLALSSRPDPNLWVTDGSVTALVADATTLYLGGEFN